MIQHSDDGLVSPSDIADIAGVSRGAVSNWRKRDKDFPAPVAGTLSKPLFSRAHVTEWLVRRAPGADMEAARLKATGAEMEVWSAMNLLRGQIPTPAATELLLSLAVARKTGEQAVQTVPGVAEETLRQVKEAVDRVAVPDLADAADYALERFARSQGKLGAESGFIGSRTTALLASLAAARPGGVLYDPACGIATALIESVRRGARPDRVVGHDINGFALDTAAHRAKLHDVALELRLTDVLSEDVDPGLQADVILLEPPFGLRIDAPGRLIDPRFTFGAPPRTAADTAWIQHAIAHLTDNGRAYVLSPYGALFRGGDEGRIRARLVQHGCVEAVVGLPGRLVPNTSIPLALWVLRRPVPEVATEPILLIDASETVSPENEVANWLTNPQARQHIPHREVSITEVLTADSVLTPKRWIEGPGRKPAEVAHEYRTNWSAINNSMAALDELVASFEHPVSKSHSRVMTVGDLIEQGLLDLRNGRPQDRYDDAPRELQDRLATAADVRDGSLRQTTLDRGHDDYPELTLKGDVLVTTMNTVRARVDEAGGHLPTTGVHRLRIRDHNVLSPGYLAIALAGDWNDRFQDGSTIQRASVKDLEVPLVPIDEQRSLENAVLSVQQIHDQSTHLAEAAGAVASALLDAVRYHAPLGESSRSPSRNAHENTHPKGAK